MKTHNSPDSSAVREDSFLTSSSEMAALIRSLDWSNTPLGPIDSWPQSLRTTVSLCLASNFPINIIWGPQNTQIYNDGYRIVCGDKHPAALGMDYTQCWASAWPAVGQPFDQACEGVTSFLENQRMFLFRNGYLEETFFTFSLSPIRDESGDIGGLFHPVAETTVTMLSERRTRALRDLTARLADADRTADVYRLMIDTLAGFDLDLPFVLLYELDDEHQCYQLVGATGIAGATCLNPPTLAQDDAGPWPMQRLLHEDARLELRDVRARLGGVACGPYEEAPGVAFAVPVHQPGMQLPQALLMAGASSRLPLDDVYRGFYDLLAAAFRAALARVAAVEEERKRADMLAAIDRAKTVFFSNVSHEFRTPLTLMLSPLEEALAAGGLPAPQQERLEIANRNALRLLKLVNSLLDFSRIEAGRTEANFVPTDLAALTADLASNFRSACTRAGLALTVRCAPLDQPVVVDAAMWEKIVLNLLSNAFKFTLSGAIEVTLEDASDGVALTVADTGVGIGPADLPRIFDRFHRVEGQHGRSVEGTGIGLSLVRELVQLHGGSIEVRSAPGEGTGFTVFLPYGAAHLPAEQVGAPGKDGPGTAGAMAYVNEALRWLPGETDAPAAPAAAPGPDGQRARIVLADDNADMRAYIQRILEDAGYQVHAVGNGKAALAAVRAGPLPELVLSDVMMPDMDGFALLAALRLDPATSGAVVILLSARAGEEARLEGLAAGADDYMVKPFGARELRARIDGAITLARQRREAAEREQALRVEIEAARGKAALTESEAHAAMLFDQTAVGMAVAGVDGRIAEANARYCDMLGRTRAELLGQALDAFVHPDDAAVHAAAFERLARGGDGFEAEHRFVRPDGSTIWVNQTVTPIEARPGQRSERILTVVLDVSERRRAEDELREAGHRKDEFLAMLAHELRNPLAPISAAAQLMGAMQLSQERLKQTSQVITRQVRHMTGLIDDLLDVSRVTRGLVGISKGPQDIHGVLANAVEQVRPLIEARHHRLVMDQAPQSARVLGDHKRLVQILTNLLNNAAKYTPEGGTIHLRSEIDQHTVTLSVQDTGIGIAPELQPRVFELFAQAERTPDRSQGGLGLGLALVESLVELHGGTVACHSGGLGQGSTFTVTLPRMAEELPSAPDDDGQVLPLAPGRKLDILVVDDNVDAAHMLKLLLEASGHAVEVEYEARGALERAARRAPDVGILDIGLPGLDGNELARRLRKRAETAGTTLIAVTGYGQEHDRQAALEAGFQHHLVKPIDAGRLIALLGEIGNL